MGLGSLRKVAEILKCVKCNAYTLKKKCKCGGKTVSPKPGKWSSEDRYGEYRLKYKEKNEN